MTSMDPTRQAWFDRARAHPVEGILEMRGFKLPLGTKNERKGPCPVCGGDDRFGLNISKQTFTCHQCGLKGAGGIDIIVGIGAAQTPWEAAEILEGPQPKPNGHNGSTAKSRRVATWIYRDADGKPYLKVDRLEKPDGKKDYPQSHWEDGKWVFGKPKGAKIPYRLPELLDSDRSEPVWITEGEKCADAVARLGLTATTASEGAGKWTPDLNEWFRDRIAYILPDNDPRGAKHAEQVGRNLDGVAREIRIVNLPDLAAGEDAHEWIGRGGTREQLDGLGEAAPKWQPPPNGEEISQGLDGTMGEESETIEPFETFDASKWNGKEPEPRKWVTSKQIPCGEPGILNGDGGTGKTFIALQLANAVGDEWQDWLGKCVEAHGPVIFYSVEEKLRELHSRNHIIRASRNLSDIKPGRLHFIADLKDPVLARPDRGGVIKPTMAMHRLEKTVEKIKPALVIIENAADVYAGNEIDRVQVHMFVRGMLGGLCAPNDAAVMLLQHPSVAGLQDKTGRSGSTGWNNAGRWRLNFTFCNADDDADDTRQLKTEKLNYGRRGEKLKVRWEKGVFVPEVFGSTQSPERTAANVSIDETFMSCLDVAIAQGRTVSDSGGKNYAPALFERMPEAKGLPSKSFQGAMERLFSAKRIQVTVTGKGHHQKRSLARTT